MTAKLQKNSRETSEKLQRNFRKTPEKLQKNSRVLAWSCRPAVGIVCPWQEMNVK
jgi:hypothetical protein